MVVAEYLDLPGFVPGPEAAPVQDRTPASGRGPRFPGTMDFQGVLSRFEPVGLKEMDSVALLDRTDTKYVMSTGELYRALGSLSAHYRVLEVAGTRVSSYRTLYFDTEDFDLYMWHHRGKRLRYKVRSREYVESSLSFLEVKRKGKRDRTTKERVRTGELITRWVPEGAVLLGDTVPSGAGPLEPKLANEFCRITLVGIRHMERVTLDVDLRFHAGGRSAALPGIAVAEVKQDGADRGSEFVRSMRAAGIRPSGFSKYCVGVSLLYEGVKHNRFKPELRLIGRLMEDSCDVE